MKSGIGETGAEKEVMSVASRTRTTLQNAHDLTVFTLRFLPVRALRLTIDPDDQSFGPIGQ
jgi:hypothetical protein